MVFFSQYQIGKDILISEQSVIEGKMRSKNRFREIVKTGMDKIFPSYRVSRRLENKVVELTERSIRLRKK